MSAITLARGLPRRFAFARSWSVRIGLTVFAFVLGVAFIGPLKLGQMPPFY